ncbi:MAG: ammonia-forming cytochrome c nitrite reductase subunit c552 [Pirellulales bacterium]|nr:ammonia-forming cytochrome c nitrite reductase subunit c552 [Pirellulales bacterium]
MNDAAQGEPSGATTVSPASPRSGRRWTGWLLFGVTTIAVFVLGLLFASIIQRRNEAIIRRPLTPIGDLETDSSVWAVDWPREHDSYRRMQDDTTKTKYGGADPRDYLQETPANVVLFAGYGFSKEYRQARGHVYAVEDVVETQRVGPATPATCWSCKSPDVPRQMVAFGKMKLGDKPASFQELLLAGAGDFYARKFYDLEDEITHPIGCLDCHDPQNMRLRVSRPALIEAFEREGRDINQASHQEMRTLVCAQCHVEYYFRGEGKYLTFPWDKGTTVERIEEYYDADSFADWTHAVSKAPMVKMQHPDYEVFLTGIHAYRDVSCADCHMPYRSEGGAKFTDHHVQSPLLNVANSCAVCHRWGEDEIRARAVSIQDKTREGRERAERTLVLAHFDIAACMEAGASDEELAMVRHLVRQGQLRWDYVASNNGMGIHSPQECTRILTAAVELAQECRVQCARMLAQKGYTEPVRYPDYADKQKAQALNQRFLDGKPPTLLAGDASY